MPKKPTFDQWLRQHYTPEQRLSLEIGRRRGLSRMAQEVKVYMKGQDHLMVGAEYLKVMFSSNTVFTVEASPECEDGECPFEIRAPFTGVRVAAGFATFKDAVDWLVRERVICHVLDYVRQISQGDHELRFDNAVARAVLEQRFGLRFEDDVLKNALSEMARRGILQLMGVGQYRYVPFSGVCR